MFFPSGSIPSGPPIESRKALLFIDFQDEFCDVIHGKLPVSNVGLFVNKLPMLAAKFRAKGSVVFVTTEFKAPRCAVLPELASQNILLNGASLRDVSSHTLIRRHCRRKPSTSGKAHDPEAFLEADNDIDRACLPRTDGARLIKELDDALLPDQDIRIVKSHYSAFTDTQLLLKLRASMTQHLYVTGSLSNISVYATVIDAVRHGLKVTLIEDCLGYRDLDCHTEAVKHMVDIMGANGVDYQELMDDLAGLLGDVIHEQDFHSQFQVTVGPPGGTKPQRFALPGAVSPEQRKLRVEESMTDNGVRNKRSSRSFLENAGTVASIAADASTNRDSSPTAQLRPDSPDISPPRKRVVAELDETAQFNASSLKYRDSVRRAPSEAGYKTNRPRVRTSRTSSSQSISLMSEGSDSATFPRHNQGFPTTRDKMQPPEARPQKLATPTVSTVIDHDENVHTSPGCLQMDDEALSKPIKSPEQRKKNLIKPVPSSDLTETIGEGDARLASDVLDTATADATFHILKRTIQWQKMFHRTGEVPRLVAVQGTVDTTTGDEPVYRHPADESPHLQPFDDTVDTLRIAAEKVVGHSLNHVLIQHYRSGEDNISEHSDKTLDIVRGSNIVNFSLGAQRVMTLRTKKQPPPQPTCSSSSTPPSSTEAAERTARRIPLSHNTLFILGPTTNQHWLHSIRPNRRPISEKSAQELAFNGERISLTFRQIGTFINRVEGTIWGQGATSKSRDGRAKVSSGEEAEREGESMIRAFGQENHLSQDWVWERWYGRGFDVVNFKTKGS